MTGWAEAPALLVAHVGGPEGHGALAPALMVLARWAGPRGARLIGLWDGPPPALAARLLHRNLTAPDLSGEAPWGAVILTDPGRTALEAGYALYLAGVPRRAGFAAEFGGGALSDPLPEPKHLAPAERHLALLAALGLG